MFTPVETITLDNGLEIKLKEIHTAPIVSHWVWYRVGSRDEPTGKTGISHWVEHLQFKGTEKFPADELEKAVSRAGLPGLIWSAQVIMKPCRLTKSLSVSVWKPTGC